MKKYRVFIADDHPTMVSGIENQLHADERFIVAGTSTQSTTLLHDERVRNSDVLLLDLNMPKLDGIDTLSLLRKNGITIKIIIHTSYNSAELIKDCRNKGADGYMLKAIELSELTENIIQIANGKKIFPDALLTDMNSEPFYLHDDFVKKFKLTKREVEIIQLICKGLKTKDIAAHLNISEFTVSTHRKNINFKVGISDSVIELYDFALRNKLIEK
jgi:DNA-binding NarL/FixJ family response regulator